MKSLVLAACLAAAGAGAARAQTQLEMNDSAARAYRAADEDLDALRARIDARLAPAERAAFRRTEEAWTAYRAAQCRFESLAVAGGSAQPMIHAFCLRNLTEARIRRLRALTIDCQEGDLGCFQGEW